METLFEKLSSQNRLSEKEAYEFITAIKEQSLNQSQLIAAIAYFIKRPITLEELTGFRSSLLDLSIPLKLDKETIDVCGTGGDCKNTFNISTLSAFVLAASGIPVAKHGNHGASSVSGSSDILSYFGYKFKTHDDELNRELDRYNLCFIHAPLFHPTLKLVATYRKELGLRTFFNLLGPLVNPARSRFKYIGVYNCEVMRLYNYLLQKDNSDFSLVHSFDGYDEISLTGAFKVVNNESEKVMEPFDLGFDSVAEKMLYSGNSLDTSGKIFLDILNYKASKEQLDVVIINSAFAMKTYYSERSISDCIQACRESLQSKRALHLFQNIIKN